VACWIDSHQDNSWHLPPVPEDEIAEILVFGKEKPALVPRQRHHLGVRRACRNLDDGANIVACLAQPSDERRIDAFVCKPVQNKFVVGNASAQGS
jgi:hypothetical protein